MGSWDLHLKIMVLTALWRTSWRTASTEMGRQEVIAEIPTRDDDGLDRAMGSVSGEAGWSNIWGEDGQYLVIGYEGGRDAGGRFTPGAWLE